MEELQKLKSYKGSGTSIVTLTIPPKTQVSNIVTLLQQEMGTATNIKDKVNRKSVINALKTATVFFKTQKSIPHTGMAVFSGHYV
jgi:peptide chain release factor subunit 1